MIEAVNIENFRCFRQAAARDLRRVNVLVGRNASGKTALLEAIFLARAAAPQIAFKLRAMRGLGREIHVSGDRYSYEALWKNLFYRLDQQLPISIELHGPPKDQRTLEVFYDKANAPVLPFGKLEVDSEFVADIVFRWRSTFGDSVSRPRFSDRGLVFERDRQDGPSRERADLAEPVLFLDQAMREGPEQNANRLSALSKQNKEKAVVEALCQEFPFVESLSVEIDAGTPTVYAAVRSIPEKIPAALVSGGVNRMVSMLLGIASFPVVLIDEMENGFHYERLASVWGALVSFSQRFDAQVFANVHSRECLEAAAEAAANNEEEFCLVRMQKDDGEVSIERFSGSELAGAIHHGFEVR